MHVIYCMYDSRVNERFLPHNSGICTTTSRSSSPYLHGFCCVCALWILWLSIVAVHLVLHLAPPTLPCRVIFFSLSSNPPITAFASVYYEKETGKEEVSERGGWGWEERAREHERRGREGCRGVREKGKWLCACVSGSSAPWQIQCWCHWSCLMWRRVYLFSPLETHTVWKFSLFLFLLHIFFFFFLFNNCGVQECFHVGTFPFKGGIIFPQIKATASLPRASSLGCFVLLSRILKSAALFAPSLPSPFTSARLRFRPSTVTCFNLPSCFPSSSVRCHWWRGTSASLVGGLWRGTEDYFSK